MIPVSQGPKNAEAIGQTLYLVYYYQTLQRPKGLFRRRQSGAIS